MSRRLRHLRGWRRRLVLVILVIAVSVVSGTRTETTSLMASNGTSRSPRIVVNFQPVHNASKRDRKETARLFLRRLSLLRVPGASVRWKDGELLLSLPNTNLAKRSIAVVGEAGRIFVRPARCGAPPFVGRSSTSAEAASASLPGCTLSSSLTASNVVDESTPGETFHERVVPEDKALGAYPSTSPAEDSKTKTVLLPVVSGGGQYGRYMLGPAALSSKTFASADVHEEPHDRWTVDYVLTRAGTSSWERFARRTVHEIDAVEARRPSWSRHK